jgi:hypothetical protein
MIAYGLVVNAKGVRRERDSNPRYPDRVHTLSKRAPSASRSSLLLLRCFSMVTDGESGIRTHGAAMRLNGFRVRPIQPLSHLSTHYDSTTQSSFLTSVKIACKRAQEDSNLRPLDPQSNALSS